MWIDFLWRGSEENAGTSGLASSVCRVASDNGWWSGGGSNRTEGGASGCIACDDDGRTASLTDAVSKRTGDDGGHDEREGGEKNALELHCWRCAVNRFGVTVVCKIDTLDSPSSGFDG